MSVTAWTSTSTGLATASACGARATGIGATLGAFWARVVTAPLHRALDAGLRAGELRELDSGTLADIGYRRS
jgi:hypothetical protein